MEVPIYASGACLCSMQFRPYIGIQFSIIVSFIAENGEGPGVPLRKVQAQL
jgi:hypothetical protein